jgi:thioredoxin reductase (NADPH)
MNTLITVVIAAAVMLVFVCRYLWKLRHREQMARRSSEKGRLFTVEIKGLYPHVDGTHCIGCGSCTTVCPEGDVLAMLGGKAVIANGHKCIGHELCAEACPVGAITMRLASPSLQADMPCLSPEYETTIENLFIAGELGGLALIKNAVNQGRDCIDTIAHRISTGAISRGIADVYDVLIVGAGPAGISASLRAIENKLSYLTLERDEIGGTVAKYPRQKLVMTSPVQFPTFGKFKKTEISKEQLLAFWDRVVNRSDFNACTYANVEDIRKGEDGIFTVRTATCQYQARAVVLALGRSGTPRKLGAKGEELPKVMYRLIEADHYINKKILIVGGGDSAIEAAMGLASQKGNDVTLCYRGSSFHRIKERNAKRIEEHVRMGKVKAIFDSSPIEFREDSVVLAVGGDQQQVLANDYVWIFAGGTPATQFLKKIGIGFGMCDVTSQARAEVREAVAV